MPYVTEIESLKAQRSEHIDRIHQLESALKEVDELFDAISKHGFGRTQHNHFLIVAPKITAITKAKAVLLS